MTSAASDGALFDGLAHGLLGFDLFVDLTLLAPDQPLRLVDEVRTTRKNAAMTATSTDDRNQVSSDDTAPQRGTTLSGYVSVSGTTMNATQCDTQYGHDSK